jgi:hypothetical protein
VPSPSLSKVRSVPVPRIPAKPKPKKPQSNRIGEPEFLKEKDRADEALEYLRRGLEENVRAAN